MKKLLVLGHPLVVDTNRALYADLAQLNRVEVTMVVPRVWKSNLIKELQYSFNNEVDSSFKEIHAVDCYFQGNGSFFFFSPFSLWKILRGEKYDGILLLQESWSLSLFFLRIVNLLTINKNSNLYLFPNQNIKKEKLKFLHSWERLLCSGFKRIFYPTSGVREVIEWKKISSPCFVLPYTFDSSKFIANTEKINSSNNLTSFKIGYLGRLTEEKGILNLLEAYKILTKSGHNVELILAGAGSLVPEIERLSGIDSRIKFLGVLKHNEAHHFYQKIDIFVLPSLTKPFWMEQFGRVLVEASASGNLVLGSSSGAIPEVLNNIGMPYCFEEDSVDDLVKKLLMAIEDFQSGRAITIINQSIIKTKSYCSNTSVAQLLENYLLEDTGL